MKERTDYSSFILGFTSEDSIIKELVYGFPDKYLDKIKTVVIDVSEARRLNKDEVIKIIKNEMCFEAEWKEECDYRNEKHCSYADAHDYLMTEDGKAGVERQLEKIIGDVNKRMNGKSIFVKVEYGEDDGWYYSDIEHEVMPEVDSTIISIDHR